MLTFDSVCIAYRQLPKTLAFYLFQFLSFRSVSSRKFLNFDMCVRYCSISIFIILTAVWNVVGCHLCGDNGFVNKNCSCWQILLSLYILYNLRQCNRATCYTTAWFLRILFRQTYGMIDRQIHGRTNCPNNGTEGRTDGGTDRLMDRWMLAEKDEQTDRSMDGQRGRNIHADQHLPSDHLFWTWFSDYPLVRHHSYNNPPPPIPLIQ